MKISIDNSNTVRQMLSANTNFLISPNLENYALTKDEREIRQSIIEQAAEVDPTTYNARLLQARHTLNKLTGEMRNALINGEDEESDYINSLCEKISVLIEHIQQLEALK